MKLSRLIALQAVVSIALGIAFSLYGPLMLAFFGLPEVPENSPVLYWNVAAFARLFGAALFGFGFILFAIRGLVDSNTTPVEGRRGIIFALLLTNGVGAFVSLTQQFSVWNAVAGWALFGLFALFFLAYAVSLATTSRPVHSAGSTLSL